VAKYVVDWDGTCVSEEWPGMGEWLPGAVEALKKLHADGGVVICTLRTHYYEPGDRIRRPPEAQEFEVARIRAKLDAAGLQDIPIYPNDRGKAPGKYYIDDRAIQFNPHKGGWRDVLRRVGA
jgi:hypothetical protein